MSEDIRQGFCGNCFVGVIIPCLPITTYVYQLLVRASIYMYGNVSWKVDLDHDQA